MIFNIYFSIALTTLAHMLNGYDICFKTMNYPIFNMQDFRYWLCTSVLDCFGQVVSPSVKVDSNDSISTLSNVQEITVM